MVKLKQKLKCQQSAPCSPWLKNKTKEFRRSSKELIEINSKHKEKNNKTN